MTRPYERLGRRPSRAMLQLLASALVIVAALAMLSDQRVARSIAMLVVGMVSLIALKVGLVGMVAARRGQPAGRVAVDLTDTVGALAAVGERVERLQLELDGLAARTPPAADSVALLVRRTEPALAELAALRHEVTYLREIVARLDRSSTSR